MNLNPYQAPTALSGRARSNALRRVLLEAVAIVAASLLGAAAVYAGEAYRWPGFQLASGYSGDVFGHWLVDLPDELVLRILAVEFACYAGIAAAVVVMVLRRRGRCRERGPA